MAVNANFDQYLTTTLNNHRSTIIDGVFKARPLFHFIKESGNVKIDGGQKIVIPVNFQKNGTFASYSGADTLDISASGGPTAAEYDWKQVSASLVINGLEEARNSGKAKIISLLDAKMKILQESYAEGLNTMWWGDGTGNTSKDMNGLTNLVITPAATVGNIVPADVTALANGASWTPYTDSAIEALTEAKMRTAFHSSSIGNDHPNVIITTQVLFEAYEALFGDQVRYQDDLTANAGFHNLTYKGVPVVYDAECPAGTMVFLNTKYLQAFFHQDTFMRATPFVRPEDKDVRISQVLTYGNLTISDRRRQGVISAMTNV